VHVHEDHDVRGQLRWKARIARERLRLENRVKHIHYDAIRFLLERYDVVICPRYATKPNDAWYARSMNHAKFRQRLVSAAEGYRDPVTGEPQSRMVWLCKENGTSGTCGHCGRWNADLGPAKVYECRTCGVRMDRDVNGARNNMLAPATALLGYGPDYRAHA
jgi:putative transposase